MPYPSIFVLNASTSKAPLTMLLQNTFEGTFDLRTSTKIWGGPKVSMEVGEGESSQDPARKARPRVVEYDKRGNGKQYKSGKMYWGEEPASDEMGQMRLVTTGKDVIVRAQ
jgi:hypothetical protein